MKTVLTVGALASVGALRGEAQLRTKVSSMSPNRRRGLNIEPAVVKIALTGGEE